MADKNDLIISSRKKPLPVKMTKETLIKSNALTNACYSLTTVEQKILWAILSQLQRKDTEFYYSEIYVEDLANFCHFQSKAKYEQVKQASINMMKKILYVPLENGEDYYTHWVQSFKYRKNGKDSASTITYQIDEKLKDELLQLKKAFTVTHVQIAMLFQSQYSIRFYDFFIQYLKIGKRKFLLDNLAEMLKLPPSYQRGYNFKARVIEPAVKEINELSDLMVDPPQYERKGRKIIAVTFTFHKKTEQPPLISIPISAPQKSMPKESEETTLEHLHDGMDDEERRIFDLLVTKAEIYPRTALKLLKEHGAACCRRNYEVQKNRKAYLHSFAGTLVRAIQEDWAGKVAALQKEKVQQEQKVMTTLQQEDKRQREKANAQLKIQWQNKPLSDFIVEQIIKTKKAGPFTGRLQARGLTVADVLAGKR